MVKQSPITEELRFNAEFVATQEEDDTEEFVVHGIYFGEGDPERGGQHWNFTRSPGEDDDGVCIVKEIQQVTIYGGIVSCELSRQCFTCEFDNHAAQETRTRKLVVTFEIDSKDWETLMTQAKFLFDGESYFKLVP